MLCTGSQGEPMSALTRIAYGDHQNVSVERGDTVIISAKPVPGNELRVHDSINRLARHGAEVLHQEIAPVHVSGHACSEEMRTLLSLVRPRAMMPIHGEYRMLAAHAQLARDAGVPDDADRDRRERLRRRAVVGRGTCRRPDRGGRHLRRRARSRRRRGRCAAGPPATVGGRRPDRRHDGRARRRPRRHRTARADRAGGGGGSS